jgi:hypothetical protein
LQTELKASNLVTVKTRPLWPRFRIDQKGVNMAKFVYYTTIIVPIKENGKEVNRQFGLLTFKPVTGQKFLKRLGIVQTRNDVRYIKDHFRIHISKETYRYLRQPIDDAWNANQLREHASTIKDKPASEEACKLLLSFAGMAEESTYNPKIVMDSVEKLRSEFPSVSEV